MNTPVARIPMRNVGWSDAASLTINPIAMEVRFGEKSAQQVVVPIDLTELLRATRKRKDYESSYLRLRFHPAVLSHPPGQDCEALVFLKEGYLAGECDLAVVTATELLAALNFLRASSPRKPYKRL